MRYGYLAAAFAGLLALTLPAKSADHTKDTPDEVKRALADGKAVLLDVREKDEWDAGHLKDAKLLPLDLIHDSGRYVPPLPR